MRHRSFGGRRTPSHFGNNKKSAPKAKGIDVSKLVNKATSLEKSEEYVAKHVFEDFIKMYENDLNSIFSLLYQKSSNVLRDVDMTLTHGNIYESLISKHRFFSERINKINYVDFIVVHHNKIIEINEGNKHSKEVIEYIDELMECEVIFFEFCELIFMILKNREVFT